MRNLILILLSFLTVTAYSAAPFKVPNDQVTFGSGSTPTVKTIEMNAGLGASNPKIQSANSGTSVEITKPTKIKGATTSEGDLTIGDGTAVNRKMTVNRGGSNPYLKWDEATAAWVFSNNGALEKKLGSGSGSGGEGGTNLLQNPSFEDAGSPVLNWTNSGGTFTQGTYTNGLENDLKYGTFVSTTSAQYVQSDLTTWPDMIPGGGQYKIKYNGGSGNFKLQVLDGSSNLLAEKVLVNSTAWIELDPGSFFAPAPGVQVRLRIVSTGAGTLNFDKAYTGSNLNISVFQKYFGPEISYTPTFTSFGTVVSPTITYQQVGGFYIIKGEFTQGTPVASEFRMSLPGSSVIKSGTVPNQIFGEFTFEQVTGTSNNYFMCGNAGDAYLKFCVHGAASAYDAISATGPMPSAGGKYKFYATVPIQGLGGNFEDAQTPKSADWMIDANIGGANPATSISSTYVIWENASLDMVINPGSADVQIPCSSTNVATSTTCSVGSEQIGVTFTNPETGYYEVCGEMGLDLSNTYVTNQWVETNDSNTGIIQEGKSRGGMFTGATNVRVNLNTCGIFYFADIKKRALRLAYEASNTAGVLILDRDTAKGQQDAHITVKKLSNSSPRAILTGDTVTSKGINKPETLTFSFGTTNVNTACTTSPCFLDQGTGTAITNITRASTGDYTINFAKTYSKLWCSGAGTDAGGNDQWIRGFNGGVQSNRVVTNSSTFRFACIRYNLGAQDDCYATLTCNGY
jgi:hypothetical protein